jgi:Holliday junction resolvase RusA-like endonuclease
MAMHLEFVVPGPPISNQQGTATGKANLAAWKAVVRGEAQKNWGIPPLTGELKGVLINLYKGKKASVDLDNMSKPIFDSMEGIVYRKDRQITQAELTHLRIGGALSIPGISRILVTALQTGSQFVYVRIEDPADPFPLPK